MKHNEILNSLDPSVSRLLKEILCERNDIQEIRLRVNKPLEIVFNNGFGYIDPKGKITFNLKDGFICTQEKINSCIGVMSNYSIYSVEEELKNGFLTLRGGHRVGIAGKAVIESGKIKTIRDINSLNIRFAKEIKGAADKIIPYIIDKQSVYHTLLVSPPQCGKTTLIRDIARQLSNGIEKIGFKGRKVGVVDERSEIAGVYEGSAQNDIGVRTDVLDACPKTSGIIMMIRAMSPEVLITDEIGTSDDISAIEQALCAGIKIITTVHGRDLGDLVKKKAFSDIIEKRIFERVVVLSNRGGPGTIEDIIDGKSLKSIFYRGNVKCI